MSDVPVTNPAVSDDGWLSDDPAPKRQWITEFQDSGETVEWTVGTAMEGEYVGSELIELKEDQLDPEHPERTHAPLLIFQDAATEERWNTWETYQIKEDRFQLGSYYRIECKRERKTAKGSMKSFKIMRDASAN